MEGPHYLHPGFCSHSQFPSDIPNMTPADSFVVDDLLDFPNDVDDPLLPDPPHSLSLPTHSNSTLTPLHSSNSSSSFSASDPNFLPDVDLCVPVPYDDMAELEWLSNVVEESFSSEDLQKLQLITGMKARNDVEASETHEFHAETNQNVYNNNGDESPKRRRINNSNINSNEYNSNNSNNSIDSNHSNNSAIFNSEVSVPAKARSKRSRGSPCNWTSRLLLLSPTPSSSPASSTSEPDLVLPAAPANPGKKPAKAAPRKRDGGDGTGGEGRKCLHCSTDKTPQWRTGPMGPKTLCNACGVRFKSGRLVPEYRPAASPTYVLTKHSNSHRKVMELRRQKEMLMRGQQPHQNQLQPHQNQFLQYPNTLFDFDVPDGDDYLIHQHVGPDFTQLI